MGATIESSRSTRKNRMLLLRKRSLETSPPCACALNVPCRARRFKRRLHRGRSRVERDDSIVAPMEGAGAHNYANSLFTLGCKHAQAVCTPKHGVRNARHGVENARHGADVRWGVLWGRSVWGRILLTSHERPLHALWGRRLNRRALHEKIECSYCASEVWRLRPHALAPSMCRVERDVSNVASIEGEAV